MEIELVINTCYGGFSLSNKAKMLYMKKQKENDFSNYEIFTFDTYSCSHCYFIQKDFMEKFLKDTHNFSTKEYFEYFRKNESKCFYIDFTYIDRSDKILVEVVKELGSCAAGDCAKLQIVKIKLNVEDFIKNHDGYEYVEGI